MPRHCPGRLPRRAFGVAEAPPAATARRPGSRLMPDMRADFASRLTRHYLYGAMIIRRRFAAG